jgi:hypothetical protein
MARYPDGGLNGSDPHVLRNSKDQAAPNSLVFRDKCGLNSEASVD